MPNIFSTIDLETLSSCQMLDALDVGLVSPAQSHDSGIDLVLSCDPF